MSWHEAYAEDFVIGLEGGSLLEKQSPILSLRDELISKRVSLYKNFPSAYLAKLQLCWQDYCKWRGLGAAR